MTAAAIASSSLPLDGSMDVVIMSCSCVMAIATLAFVCYVRMDGKSEEDQLLIDTDEEEEADQCPMVPLETEDEPWAADYSSVASDDDVV
ncbi:hypothetical protein FOZ61_005614 [Perkinsus olseni]|uniref:Uncharacterized protein n=1 Tax=Perkinsus olseni TaxID=32597 RepID=A0A7J6MBB9_PEROL|nr:hypothetical protein FOZ61_005614 [Perkinsus olseni]